MRNGARRMMIIAVIIAGTIGLQFSFNDEVKAGSPHKTYIPLVINPSEPTNPEWEQEVIVLINQIRVENGLAPLNVAPELMHSARWYSQDMALNGSWNHNGSDGSSISDRMIREGYIPQGYGECIAWFTKSDDTKYYDPAAVINAWMASPGHKAIILATYLEDVGVGYYEGNGKAYYTADFGVRADSD